MGILRSDSLSSRSLAAAAAWLSTLTCTQSEAAGEHPAHLVSGRPESHNGQDPALRAYRRRGAAVAAPHRRTSQGRAPGHSLAAVPSRLARPQPGAVLPPATRLGPTLANRRCHVATRRQRGRRNPRSRSRPRSPSRRGHAISHELRSEAVTAPACRRIRSASRLWSRLGSVHPWVHLGRDARDAPSCPLMRMETESWGPGSICEGCWPSSPCPRHNRRRQRARIASSPAGR